MTKVIIIFITGLLAVAYALPTAIPMLSTTENPSPFIDPKCTAAVEQTTKTCNATIEAKWTKSSIHQEMIEAEKKGEMAKAEEIKTHLTCCALWDLIPCAEHGIGDKCNTKDYQFVWMMLEWAKSEAEKQLCKSYHYSDREEKCLA